MDTISRENNSMLPIGGIVVGVVALLLGGYAAISLSKVNKSLAAHEDKLTRVETLESQISSAAADAAKANKGIADYARQTQDAFTTVGTELGKLREDITKMQAVAVKPITVPGVGGKKGAAGAASAEPAVAGPGEYVVKGGDTLKKISVAQGCSLKDLESVNPGVDSSHLKVGQKLKLPAKH